MTAGTLYGIGVGPGDPELITVKALRRLQSSPVVAFPAGRQGQMGVAQRAIAAWLTPEQIQLPLHFPYVQDSATLTQAWQRAATTVWPYLANGQDVVFASEGDISFYSTFTYLAQSLQQAHSAVQIEAIPGVCSPLAAAAALGIPLTLQGQRLAMIPALYRVSDLETVLVWADVLVLLKVSSVYREVWQILHQHQLLQRSYIVQRATTDQQIVYADLRRYPDLQLPYFSLLIVQVREWIEGRG
ncbi:MAG: precorrin-2 C(20)-methyltransferase [Cyanobacteria bacterium P01_F01_bin.4]